MSGVAVQRTGYAKLPLHYGRAPRYLFVRMRRMAREIVSIIVDEYGSDEFLKRVSDPFWFQALGCVLGYDWHSSGVTTVLTGVLKEAVSPQQHGIAVCGGKGRASRKTPTEIGEVGEEFGFSTANIEALRRASRMSAKVDNTAVQAGYQLYHHAFFIANNKKWAVVQQGMCSEDRTARRYHWLSDNVRSFVLEPHSAIVSDVKRNAALNMTAKESEGCRKVSVDLVREEPKRLIRMLQSVRPEFQKSLSEWLPKSEDDPWAKHPFTSLSMPRSINWKTLREIYEFQPRDYEELLGWRGVGPATVRGLALVADVIYGEKPSWKDPVKYSFAYGGKDGVPYPVDRKAMDESVQILKHAVEEARIGNNEKTRSLRALMQFVPQSMMESPAQVKPAEGVP
jgi:hypothetical protein